MTRIRVKELPFDVQVLLDDMLGADSDAEIHRRLWTHHFTVRHVALSRFPRDISFCDYRNEDYAREMIGGSLPPIVLCGDMLLDGRHRVWVARQEGRRRIAVIDLSEIGFTCDFQPACTLSTPNDQ